MTANAKRIAALKRQLAKAEGQPTVDEPGRKSARYICITCGHIKVDEDPDYKAVGTTCWACGKWMSFTHSIAGRMAAISILGHEVDECAVYCTELQPSPGLAICMGRRVAGDDKCSAHTNQEPEEEFSGTLF